MLYLYSEQSCFILFFTLYAFNELGGLSAMICELFVVVSYLMDNNANLTWVSREITFNLSFDLKGRFGFIAIIMGSNNNRTSARGCIV